MCLYINISECVYTVQSGSTVTQEYPLPQQPTRASSMDNTRISVYIRQAPQWTVFGQSTPPSRVTKVGERIGESERHRLCSVSIGRIVLLEILDEVTSILVSGSYIKPDRDNMCVWYSSVQQHSLVFPWQRIIHKTTNHSIWFTKIGLRYYTFWYTLTFFENNLKADFVWVKFEEVQKNLKIKYTSKM
jgi:hypothetical protein